jgi:aminoglycoside N3'-acetyltransferase
MAEHEDALTQAEVEKDLRALGLRAGMMLEVHSSLRSIGLVEGGAETVVRALMAVIGGEGAIVMPSFQVSRDLPLTEDDKARRLKCKVRLFMGEDYGKSGMGAIADAFRKYPGVVTGEGPHRVSAWGKDAEAHSEGFQRLIDADGYALLLGVDINRLTSMHYMEGKLPKEIQAVFETPEELKTIYPPDEWFIATENDLDKAWYKVQAEAYKRGRITDGFVGKGKCMFFKVNDVIRIYEKALEEDPFGLYGFKRS